MMKSRELKHVNHVMDWSKSVRDFLKLRNFESHMMILFFLLSIISIIQFFKIWQL